MSRRRNVALLTFVSALAVILALASPAAAQDSPAPLEPDEGVMFGAWPASGAAGFNSSINAVADFEDLTQSTLDYVVVYRPPHTPDLNVVLANHWLANGKIPVISWRVGPDEGPSQGDNVGADVVAGLYDEQIRARAAEAREIEGPWFSRLFHEMDGFLGEDYDLTPELFEQYWRRIHTIFEEEGVTNAVWLWTTANFDDPDGDWYPGDDVVDWIGLDQFLYLGDAGADRCTDPNVEYETLDQKIGQDWWDFAAEHPDKPIMLAEWGTGWKTGDDADHRANFIASAADVIADHPKVKALSWFNSDKTGGCEWSLESGSAAGTDAYTDLVNDGQYEVDIAQLVEGWIPGAGSAAEVLGVEVMHTVTCLAGNGRVNTNIVNTTNAAAPYRLEFQGLSPRQSTVAAWDWWRMPVTGRDDGSYRVVVKRGGQIVSDRTLVVDCDGEVPTIDRNEIRVVNSCRANNGYLLFQFTNPSAEQKGWVIEFEGVPNRSTSAAPWGQAVRAVTGRSDGMYTVRFRVGTTYVEEMQVIVDCDP